MPRGEVGLEAFSHIVSDPRTRNIPLILETPSHECKDGEVWRAEIAALHTLVLDSAADKRRTVGQASGEVNEIVDAAAKAENEAKKAKELKRGTKRKKVLKKDRDESDDSEEDAAL